MHVQSTLTAEVSPGQLRLDGSDAFLGPGVSGDALLATLVFDVDMECATTTVDFDLAQPFPSTLSFAGYPLPTSLTNTPGFALDDTPPVFDPYADITMAADASSAGGCAGAVVSYPAPTVIDGCPGPISLDCVPPSGSFFPAGTTTVTCTATDSCGNASVLTFDVTITSTNLVDVEVHLVGVDVATSRCIRFELDVCSTAVDATLSFLPGGPAVATATIEVPCGSYAGICAKDEQHTLWATSPLVLSVDGARYEATTVLSLQGGDTDDDGDVDIDDVTWLLSQFGSLHAAGGCPWDGTRDADFSDNGAVGSEDYTFLVANWLATSGCVSCPATAAGGHTRTSAPVVDEVTRSADFDGNGTVDFHDVQIFEDARGLDRELSRLMRATQSR
jgi:polyisoprenoid-binding protein YceI